MENWKKYLATATLALSTALSSSNYELPSSSTPSNIGSLRKDEYLVRESKLESYASLGKYNLPNLAGQGIPYLDPSKNHSEWYQKLNGNPASVKSAIKSAYSI